MANDNIYYINLKPYYYDLQFDNMIEQFSKSILGRKILKIDISFEEFKEFMKRETEKYNYDYIEKTKEEYEIDKILGKHVLSHLQYFFNDSKISKKNKSRKNNMNMNTSASKPKKNKTIKYY
jgi:hypothetical protein